MTLHALLTRQLNKLGLDDATLPTLEQWQTLVSKVSAAYQEHDERHILLERSLTLAAEEMTRFHQSQQQLSAAQLSQQRDKLQVLMHSLGVGVCALDKQGVVEVMNPVAEQLLDSAHGALIGRRFSDAVEILNGADLTPFDCGTSLLDLVAAGKPFEHHDAWFRVQQNFVIPVSFVLSPLLHESAVTGAVLVFQNIYERKRADEARAVAERLKEQRHTELLRLTKSTVLQRGELVDALKEITSCAGHLLNVARASVWLFPEDGTSLLCHDLYESATGAHSAGTTLSMANFPRYAQALHTEEVIAATGAEADARTSEFTDVYLKPLGITSMLDAPIQWRGRLVGVLCLEHTGSPREWFTGEIGIATSLAALVAQALEAEDRARTEQALRTSEERTRLVIDTSLDAVIGMDAQGVINYWNRQAEQTFGWSSAEATGCILHELIIPRKYREAHCKGLERFLQTGVGRSFNKRLELSAIRRDGSEFPIELSISPMKVGSTHYFSAFIEDISERTRLQEERAQTSQFLDSLVDSMPIMVFVKDAKTLTYLRWNKAAEDLTGLPRTEVLGKSDRDIMPEEEALFVNARDGHVLDTGTLLEIPEEELTTRNGDQRLLHTKIFPILSRDGQPLYLLGVSQDITARQQAESKLRENEEKYRGLFESSRDAIVLVFPPNWTFTAANPAAVELFGADSVEHLTSLGPTDVSPQYQPDGELTADKARRMIDIALAEGSHSFEWTHKQIRGQNFTASILLTRITIYGQPGLQATVRDITAQKLAEESLRASQARLSLTVQGARVGIWDWDIISNAIQFSPEWAAQLGYTLEEVPQTFESWALRLHLDDRQRVLADIQAFLTKGRTQFESEYRLQHRDGTYRWILSRGSLLTEEGTLSRRLLGINLDVTDRRKAEDELREAKNAAEAASRAKSEFLANMSHEIRTPMNGVIGMTELLKSTELTKTQQHYLETIATSGESLLLLINDILDFSKIEAGKLELQPIDFDLRTLVESVLEQLAGRAQQQQIELGGFFQATVPTAVHGDPGRIRQILTNLVANAVKFPHKGEVIVRVLLESLTDGQAQTAAIRINVTDTGIGINEAGLQRLFQSFTQVDGSTTRQYGGTGLGLAISKQLTELMGGRIGVTSQLGKGSTFWVVLPLRIQNRPSTPLAVPPSLLKGKRVCIVESHQSNQDILQHYIQSWGMTTVAVASAAAALSALERAALGEEPIHAVVMDYQLPDMDGMTLATAIHLRPEFAEVPLVLMTAFSQRGDGEAAVRAGCAAYLTKPLRYLDLYECLLQVLGATAQPGTSTLPALITRHSLAESRAQRHSHVLVVEDHPVNQEVAALLLRNMGCRVDVAGSGREAVEAVTQTAYDLVFMDCQMPGMDGYAATCAIRKLEQERQTVRMPIVALTAHALQGDRQECINAGMDDYLMKPFTKEGLKQILDRWLTQREALPASHAPSAFEPRAESPAAKQESAPATAEQPTSTIPIATAHAAPPAEGTQPSSCPAVAPPTAAGSNAVPPAAESVDRKSWAMFTELDEPGQPSALCHFMSIFLRDTALKMEELRQAVGREDAEVIWKLAHSLKSVSAVLGAMRLSTMYKEMERDGRASDLPPIQSIWPQVETEFSSVCSVFREELTRRGVALPQA